MYKVIKNGDNTSSAVAELVADTTSDITDLPTDLGAGSSCIVIENSSVWMLGNDKEWHQL